MFELLEPFAESCALFIELIGILVIVVFSVYTVSFGAFQLARKNAGESLYHQVRQRLGRGILLGLEFLVAADIIHTVAVELSYKSVGILAAILLIRTFLSFTLELELSGSWPWQRQKNET